MKQVPILLLSDAPDQHTGLARITRDLATLLATSPRFRVATLGLGGTGSVRFPWQQYQLSRYPNGYYEYGELTLPQVWDDWAGGDTGIIFTIWDLSRMLWLAQPGTVEDEHLARWLQNWRAAGSQLWSYVPVDSTGPWDQLTHISRETLLGIDRIVTYSPWAADVVGRTIGQAEAGLRGLDWLPHGLQMEVWQDAGAGAVRDSVHAVRDHGDPSPDSPCVGVVATNQARKDWGLTAAICSELSRRYPAMRFWWHVDTLIRHWSIPALLADYRLEGKVDVTLPPLDDRQLAAHYRQCSVTLHPGLGEGFGYPIFESLACGVPALHGCYAGGASIMETCGLGDYLIPVNSWRLDTQQNCLRPVYRAEDWVAKIELLLPLTHTLLSTSVAHLDWQALGPRWLRWFTDGIAVRRITNEEAVAVVSANPAAV